MRAKGCRGGVAAAWRGLAGLPAPGYTRVYFRAK